MIFNPVFLAKNKITVDMPAGDEAEYRAAILVGVDQKLFGVPVYQYARNGLAQFRLDNILKAYPFPNTFPDPDITSVQHVPHAVIPFRLAARPAVGTFSDTLLPVNYAVNAGVPAYRFGVSGNPLNAPAAFGHRLTYLPDLRRISLDQPEFIFFLNNMAPAVTAINVTAKIVFEDGTTTTVQLAASSVSPMQLYAINASPHVLDDFLFNRKLARYEITVADAAGNIILPKRCYDIDTRYHQNEHFIIFQNSLSGWDTLRCFGSDAQKLNVTRTLADVPAGRLPFSIVGRRMLELNTGHQEQDMQHALADLHYAKNIFLFDGIKSPRLNLTNSDFTFQSSQREEPVTLEFEFVTEDFSHAPA